jgi:hypothetical protein
MAENDSSPDPVSDASYGPRIDELLPKWWSDDVVAALDRWKQGDLIKGSPLFWAGPEGDDPVLPIVGGTAALQVHDDGTEEDCWVIITSQTCDVAGLGPGMHHPFVTVSPVYALPVGYSQGKLEAISRGEVGYLVRLTQPPESRVYVADLRVSLPVSKGALVNDPPTGAWAQEADRLTFAEAVATKIRRPALHDALSTELTQSLNKHIKLSHKAQPEWWERVEQVRLRIVGDRLKPQSVSLLVCCEVELSAEQCDIWRQWQPQATKILQKHEIVLGPPFFGTLDKMPARLYKDSIPLRLPALGRLPVW